MTDHNQVFAVVEPFVDNIFACVKLSGIRNGDNVPQMRIAVKLERMVVKSLRHSPKALIYEAKIQNRACKH